MLQLLYVSNQSPCIYVCTCTLGQMPEKQTEEMMNHFNCQPVVLVLLHRYIMCGLTFALIMALLWFPQQTKNSGNYTFGCISSICSSSDVSVVLRWS